MSGGKQRIRSANSDADLQAFLRGVFACSAEAAASIGARASVRRYPARAVILKQGERAEITFLMIAGKAHALTCGPDGQLVLLHEFHAGDFFGAVAQVDPAPEDAEVIAIEVVRASTFRALDFLELIENYACVGVAVSRTLFRQLRVTTTRMVERTTLSAAGRVHMELLRLARLGDGKTLNPAPVLSVLAVRVNSTRETVSRTISTLERRGVIRREGKALVIVAPRRLEEMII
jgi:CRP/FNR family cyclic AMP-dependent transcriptional regulator